MTEGLYNCRECGHLLNMNSPDDIRSKTCKKCRRKEMNQKSIRRFMSFRPAHVFF